jgi:hypothetical protein
MMKTCVLDDIEADMDSYQLIDEVKILFGDNDVHDKGMTLSLLRNLSLE